VYFASYRHLLDYTIAVAVVAAEVRLRACKARGGRDRGWGRGMAINRQERTAFLCSGVHFTRVFDVHTCCDSCFLFFFFFLSFI
jgi:hypothetical protein